jgi:hypothetical protein
MRISDSELCPCESGKMFGDCHGERIRRARARPSERRIRLTVIPPPDPGTRSVFERQGAGTVIFEGTHGTDALECGECGAVLAIGVMRNQFRSLVLRCGNCEAFNET